MYQFPINEEFDAGTPWSYTNGEGLQNYGGAENYATFNIGLTPYPNSAVVFITSPVYDLSACLGVMTVTFPLSGIIETNFDFAYFQYFDAGGWITVQIFTGFQNTTYSYFGFPNTTTQFRFALLTDGSVNTYFSGGSTNTYYYDIASFDITCDVVLPIELTEFSCSHHARVNLIQWSTSSETNSDYFFLESSTDNENWSEIYRINGAGNSSEILNYSYRDTSYQENSTNYYRLTEVDFDGESTTFDIISIFNEKVKKEILKTINLLGQEVDENYIGVKILIFTDGTTKKIVGQY